MSKNNVQNSPFLREKGSGPNALKPRPKPKVNDEFRNSYKETGKLNWKKAPKEIKVRYWGIYAVLFSIPLIFISSYEMYRRLEGKSTKKVQEGELLEDRSVRKFSEAEKWKVEKDSIMYRIFGKDFFLDGFTSRTMKKEMEKNETNKSDGDK